MSRRSRLWKATMRRQRHFARYDADSGWMSAFRDALSLAAMPFVRCARSWRRTSLRRAR